MLLGLVAAVAAAGCGGGKGVKPDSWRPGMERWYRNPIRPSEPPRLYWSRREQDLFLRRVGHADVVALGTLRLINLFSQLGEERQMGLAFHADEVLHGSLEDHLDENGELYLSLKPGDQDFYLSVKVQRHLPGTRFVLLIKFKPTPGDNASKPRTVVRWSLYRHEKGLVRELRAMFRSLEQHQDED